MVFSVIAWLAWVPLGFVVVSWMAAESPRDNHEIPPSWRAGVADHGSYYRWPPGTVRDAPFAFAGCVLLLIGDGVFFVKAGVCFDREKKRRGGEANRGQWWLRILVLVLGVLLAAGVFAGLVFIVSALHAVKPGQM